MPRIILSSLACPTLQYFPTLSHKWHTFQAGDGEKLLNTKCVFRFSLRLLSEIFLGEFAKLRKTTIGFGMSVRMEEVDSHWADFVKFGI
jgi:hypothetical protein